MMVNIVLGHQSEQAIAAVAVFRTLECLIIAFFTGFSDAGLASIEEFRKNHEARLSPRQRS